MNHDDTLAAIVAETDEDRHWEMLRDFAVKETPAAHAVAEQALASDDAMTRRVAADVLGSVASFDGSTAAAIADALIPRLEVENDAEVLDSVIVALGHAGDPRARAGVLKHAEHSDENVRLAVAWSLPSLDLNGEALAVLRRLSADQDDEVRDWATFGLAHSEARDPATADALAARTEDPDDDTRAEGILGLARRQDPRARLLLARELSRPEHDWRIDEALEELDG